MITKQQLTLALPGIKQENVEKYIDALNEQMNLYSINTPARAAAFLAQCAHECANFSVVSENLNYSADALLRVFPKYFGRPPKANAQACARKPEAIANIVYANRMGNGDTESGDGWKYRGRGCIQLTGKNNYSLYGKDAKINIHDDPNIILTPTHAVGSACWFWTSVAKLNSLADQNTQDAFLTITKRINGGTHGWDDRLAKWKTCKKALGA